MRLLAGCLAPLPAPTMADFPYDDFDGDGFTELQGDCDDEDVATYPDSTEPCADGVDRDCDGTEEVCSVEGDATLAEVASRIDGLAAGDRFGAAVAGRDVNGTSALLVGAPGRDAGTGAAYLLLPDDTSASGAAWSQGGMSSDQGFGTTVALLGDVDANGYTDLAVGSPDLDVQGRQDAGTLELYLDPLDGSQMSVGFPGQADRERAGSSVAALGDTDADGHQDFVYGSPGGANEAGVASVCRGTASRGTVDRADLSGDAGSHAGMVVAGPGDVDADGLPDVLVGAPEIGAAWLLYSPVEADGSLADADARWTGTGVGTALAGADVEGNGRSQVVLGTPDAVYVVKAGSSIDAPWARFDGEAGGIAAMRTTVVVGAPATDTVYVVRPVVAGVTELADATLVLTGEAGEETGAAIATFDGNLLIGAPGGDAVWFVDGNLLP